jgi:fructokinase
MGINKVSKGNIKVKKTVVAFGEVLWDILPTATVLGGAPFNFTYRINSLGNNGHMISRLGKDELGDAAFRKIKDLGMSQNLIQWDKAVPTGKVEVSFDDKNNPDYVIISDVAYDRIEINNNLLNTVSKADCICFGTLAQRSDISKSSLRRIIAQAKQAIKFFDINLRKNCYSSESIVYSLQNSNILKLNQDEALQLAEMFRYKTFKIPEFCKKIIADWQLDYCIVTLDKMGAFVYSHAYKAVYEPGYDVHLVDSLGAGDAFSAGFVHKILQGKSLGEACSFGNKLGAKVATQKGATVPIDISELDWFDDEKLNRNIRKDLEEYIR